MTQFCLMGGFYKIQFLGTYPHVNVFSILRLVSQHHGKGRNSIHNADRNKLKQKKTS